MKKLREKLKRLFSKPPKNIMIRCPYHLDVIHAPEQICIKCYIEEKNKLL